MNFIAALMLFFQVPGQTPVGIFSTGASSSILVASATGTAPPVPNNATTNAVNTTGAKSCIAAVSAFQAAVTFSDSLSNSWTQRTNSVSTNSQYLFYVNNPTVGAGHTFTASTTAGFPGLSVYCFTRNITLDQYNQASGSGTTIQPGSITPSMNNALIITDYWECSTIATLSVNSGFVTPPLTSGYVAGQACNSAISYFVQSAAAAAINPTWTNNAGTNLFSQIISFN